MADLRLLALDSEDLEVISAATQDAVIRVPDMGYAMGDQRFALLMNRYAWEVEEKRSKGQRKRAALSFARVTHVATQGINMNAAEGVLELLDIRFEATDLPAGVIELRFAGGGTIRLTVECIEARLEDLGAAWAAIDKPEHRF
ncbi:MAG: DUF2948 family protein [Devosia sp.]|jgi:hypothetical protein|nr:DUF2948 family protein [Devosiaceae bacterium]